MKLDALVLATVVGTVLAAAGAGGEDVRSISLPEAQPDEAVVLSTQSDALRTAPDHIEPGRQEPEDRQTPNKTPPEEDKGTPEQKLFALAEFSTGRTPEELRAELQALLADGVDVNAKTRGNTNALLLAAWKGSIDMIKLLVEAGADVDQSGALFSAAARGDVEICTYLLNNGATAEKKSITGETALQFALRSNTRNDEVVRLLRDRGAASASLHTAAEAGDLAALRRLVAAGSDVDALDREGLPPLTLAARTGQLDACRLLLELGADPGRETRRGDTPLEHVLWRKTYEAVPLLIEHSPPEVLPRALLLAAIQHKPDIMRQILARMPDPGESIARESLRLRTALQFMSEDEVRILEETGVQLPLWAAARFGRLERIRGLLAGGADVNAPIPDATRETPVFFAIRSDRHAAAKLLLENGADPNAGSRNGTCPTPLHEAATRGATATVKLLLEHGTKPNPLDSLDYPPLWYAVKAGNIEVAQALLEGGADPNIKVDTHERDAVGNRIHAPLWRVAKDPKLVALLKAHGAR
jgi:ankyrin repeat protein